MAVLMIWADLTAAGRRERPRAGPRAFETLMVGKIGQVDDRQGFMLVNIHVPYEGELPSTDAFIRVETFSSALDCLPSDRAAAIVLYSRSGRVSEIAATRIGRTWVQQRVRPGGRYARLGEGRASAALSVDLSPHLV